MFGLLNLSMPVRLLLIALLAVSLFAGGYIKGRQYEQLKQSDHALNVLTEQLVKQNAKIKSNNTLIEKFSTERAKLQKENADLSSQLKDLLNDERYEQCGSSKEVMDKINEMLK